MQKTVVVCNRIVCLSVHYWLLVKELQKGDPVAANPCSQSISIVSEQLQAKYGGEMPALRVDRAGQPSSNTRYLCMLPAIDTNCADAGVATVEMCMFRFVCFDRQHSMTCAVRIAPVARPGSWNWEYHVVSSCVQLLQSALLRGPVDQPRRGEIKSFTRQSFAFASHPSPSTRLSTSRLWISRAWCSSAFCQ
jgi:hypothetical protein